MKKILIITNEDKKNVKIINQTIYGFELFLTGEKVKSITDFIKESEENKCEIDIAWQMKFNINNFVLYKNCKFYEKEEYNYVYIKPNYKFYKKITIQEYYSKFHEQYKDKYKVIGNSGIKIKVGVSEFTSYYSKSQLLKGKKLKGSKNHKTFYKDGLLLERMLKINKIGI